VQVVLLGLDMSPVVEKESSLEYNDRNYGYLFLRCLFYFPDHRGEITNKIKSK
jgi:hypothetical protein